jgi:hypothetical protein
MVLKRQTAGTKCNLLQATTTKQRTNREEKDMMITEMLDKLLEMAKNDKALKDKLLSTRESDNPIAEFCKIATEAGLPMTVMDIVNQGEEFYAEIKRSTNGGGENSPDLDFQNDEYSIFMMRLKDLK